MAPDDNATKLTARLFDASEPDREVEVESGMVMPTEKQVLWVDVDREPGKLASLDSILGWNGLLPRLQEAGNSPRIAESRDAALLRVVGLERGTSQPGAVTVDLVATNNIVVSIHERPIEGLGPPVQAGPEETTLGDLDAAAFIAVLLTGMLTGYFRAVEEIERQIDDLDEQALKSSTPEKVLADLVDLRRQIAALRRALGPQREVFYALERPEILADADDRASWSLIANRFGQATDAVENARELLVGTFDIVMARTSQRTNDVMRVLTVVSAVLLPSVVIAGVMGMNFKAGFFDDPANFFVVIAAMVALALAILAVGRWRHWI